MRKNIEALFAAVVGAFVMALVLVPFMQQADASYVPLPSGAILHFNTTTCPSGWSEFTSARGDVIVGRVSGGTLNTQVGTPFTDLENRTHTHSLPSLQLLDTSSLAWATGSIGLNSLAGALGWYDGASFFNAGTASAGTRATNPGGTGTGTSGTATGLIPYIELLTCQKN